MSFAFDVKREIYRRKNLKPHQRVAQAYGLILFSRRCSAQEMGLITERHAVARIYTDFIYETVGIQGSVTLQESRRGEDSLAYTISVDDPRDRERILAYFQQKPGRINESLLTGEGALCAFLGGVYLACGTVTDPQKNYLLEFTIYNPTLEQALTALLTEAVAAPKVTYKRGLSVLYYRESEHIEDALALMGASTGALTLMEVKIFKDMRNKVNRMTNCETANIDKTVTAASEQVEAIRYLLEQVGETGLPEDLQQLARLRLENPDLSLRELSELLNPPITRSGVNHRLARLRTMAQELRDRDSHTPAQNED